MRFIILFLALFLYAEELKIRSKYFSYNPEKRLSLFKHDVNATKGKDNILADEIKIFFKEDKKPLKIIANGHVKFILALDKNTTYKGHTDKLTYNLVNGDIILDGDSAILKLETNESVKANKIILNKNTKKTEVIGAKKPIEIIIKVK
jgi:lipopolysaccharide export system protein LptA